MLEPDGKIECTALAQIAVHPDITIHKVDQFADYSQPQAGALNLPSVGGICLEKLFENPPLHIWGNTRTGVRHSELQTYSVGIVEYFFSRVYGFYLYCHLSTIGELDGITN